MRRALVAVLVTAAGVLPGPSHAAESGEFSLRPVRPATAEARDRSYVVRTVRPGTVLTDRLEAVNLTAGPLDLTVAAVDATVGPDGTFTPGTERRAEGAWIEVTPAQVRVPARGTAPVDLRIRVPADAAPGDHIATVVAQKAGAPSGGGVQLVQRVGVRVYLTVERPEGGVGARSFEFRALRWVGAPSARTFEAEVANTGALLVEPLGTLTLSRGDLGTDADVPVLGAVPAGESRRLRFTVPGELEPGRYEARLRLRDVQGGPEQEQRVSFTVGGRAAADDDGFPVAAAAVAVLALLGAVAFLLLLRRRLRPAA